MERIDIRILLNKLRSKVDRINFMRELGFILPDSKGFDVKFFIQVLKGEKDLLRIGQFGGPEFPWFTKTNHFTKNHLLSYFMNDQKLRRYLPDDVHPETIKRNYLINVIFNARREIYNKMYADYKLIKSSRDTEKWNGFYINVAGGVSNTIAQYKSIDNGKKNLRPFRLSKNGTNLNLFEKNNNLNDVEEVIPKVNYIPNDIPIGNNINIEDGSNFINIIEDKKIEDINPGGNEILNQMIASEHNSI